MKKKIRIGISACLMGFKYRYDGTSKFKQEILDSLKEKYDFVPVCPEVECGLDVPRLPMRLEASAKGTRMRIIETGEDITEVMNGWVTKKLDRLEDLNIAAFIFKARSPSCGLKTKVFTREGRALAEKSGIFASHFKRRFPQMTVCDEEDFPEILEKLL